MEFARLSRLTFENLDASRNASREADHRPIAGSVTPRRRNAVGARVGDELAEVFVSMFGKDQDEAHARGRLAEELDVGAEIAVRHGRDGLPRKVDRLL